MNRTLARVCLVLVMLAGAMLLRAEQAPPSEPIIELPKYVVTDNRELPPPESWRYATIPGFEILSNASVKSTQSLIRDFQLFRLGLTYIWPVPEKPAFPVSLILCGRGAKFDAFVPAAKDAGPAMARASLFFRHGDKSAIVIDLQASVIDIASSDVDDPATGTDSSHLSVDHAKQLNREYVRYLLSQSEPRLPAWFEEGLTQIIMRMTVEPDLIEFGRLEDPNEISAQAGQVAAINALTAADDPDSPTMAAAPAEDRDFNAALRNRALMSFPKLFAVTHDDPVAVNPLGNNTWAKQAYAFVHMCLFGRGGRYNKAFSQLLLRSTQEPITEQVFKECFRFPKGNGFREMGFRDMLIELRGYIDMADYKIQAYRKKKGGESLQIPPLIALRDATPSEVGRIKGQALVLAGNTDRARTELIAPYIRGERDPNLLAALALYDETYGDVARARKLFTAATAGSTTNPEAYYGLAQMRFADATAKPEGGNGSFSAEQVKGIVDLLVGARRHPPPLVGVYELLGDTWLKRGTKITTPEMGTLIEGLRRYPGRLKLAYEIGVLAVDAGMFDVAQSMVEHGLKYSPDPATKARFAQLQTLLPPPGATPPAPTTAK